MRAGDAFQRRKLRVDACELDGKRRGLVEGLGEMHIADVAPHDALADKQRDDRFADALQCFQDAFLNERRRVWNGCQTGSGKERGGGGR